MIDKSLVKKRFEKSLLSYDENAIVQKMMASKLISLLPQTDFNSIFEIGCATGILTKEIKNHTEFNIYCANDIVENSKDFITKIIPESTFISGDIEEIKLTEKYDLIISNACLQWCNNIESTLEKLMNSLTKNGILLISIFGNENLKEIKDIFNIENQNYDIENLKKFLSKYNFQLQEEYHQLEFTSLTEILKHLKNTGVNAIREIKLTKTKLKELEHKYAEKYTVNNSVILTYNPVYLIIKKKNDIE